MRFYIIGIGVMHIVGSHKGNVQLPADLQQAGVHHPLFRQPVVLQFQKVISFAKTVQIPKGCFLRFINQPLLNISGHFPCQAGGKRNKPLMTLSKKLHIHTGLVIIAFCKTTADNLHQVVITGIIFRKQNKVVISVLTTCQFFIKAGIRSHIDFTAKNRVDSFFLAGFIKVDHAIHHTMIRDSGAVHAKVFYPLYIFFNFVGTV